MPSFIARIRDGPAIREHKNLYGKGITPAYNADKDVMYITFTDNTRESADQWLAEHDFSEYSLIETLDKPTPRSLSLDVTTGRVERTASGGLVVRGVKLLAEGVWTDSLQKTPWRLAAETLERFHKNWTDDTVWNRHSGGQHRAVTDKVGRVENVRYGGGAVVGDVNLHGITQNSRDAAALVEAGEINYVSVETLGRDIYNPETREYEAQEIQFTGLALVNRGACKVCTLRENAEPITHEHEKEEEGSLMTPEEVAALKAEITKDLTSPYESQIKELAQKVESLEKEKESLSAKLKEMAEAEAEIKTRQAESLIRDLSQPAGYRVTVDSNGEVYPVED